MSKKVVYSKSDIIELVMQKIDLPKSVVTEVFNHIIDAIRKTIKDGWKLRINRLFTAETVIKTRAHINPITGEPLPKKPRKYVKFNSSKTILE